jgi:hypothetical protein
VFLERLELDLISTDEDGSGGRHSSAKKDGTFEFTAVPEGSYSLSVWGLEHEAYVKSVRYGSEDALEKGIQVEGGGPQAGLKLRSVLRALNSKDR